MTAYRKLSVIAVLVLSTLLWGTAVAAHQHWGGDVEHCETCLLPHAAHIPSATDIQIAPPSAGNTGAFIDTSIPATVTPAYRGRAPPR